MNQPKRGRGQPKKEPTKVLAYRVPLVKAEKIDTECRKIITKIKNEKDGKR